MLPYFFTPNLHILANIWPFPNESHLCLTKSASTLCITFKHPRSFALPTYRHHLEAICTNWWQIPFDWQGLCGFEERIRRQECSAASGKWTCITRMFSGYTGVQTVAWHLRGYSELAVVTASVWKLEKTRGTEKWEKGPDKIRWEVGGGFLPCVGCSCRESSQV